MKTLITGGLVAVSLLAATPAVLAQSIDIGPGGVRLDPRTPREREIDAIRREERREELREERRDAIRDDIRRERRRREFEEDGPPPRRY
ncbi:hypothetical protein LOK46_24135 [Methylobacterium sp. NMS14P]|uniref:hypothetical protein n=1 Tax=unclassified Methylobacterium TaxID=2615210 RepID=UPI002358EF96|nr:hypothetical protein [Methylobacterium sp. NMS14P]WCS24198.1 hypothetical protein LOK46_24135 [Methylobacterium sp. NMS14P]